MRDLPPSQAFLIFPSVIGRLGFSKKAGARGGSESRSASAGSDGKEKKKKEKKSRSSFPLRPLITCTPPHFLVIISFTIGRVTGDEAGARYHATTSGLDISVISTLVTDLNHG